MITENAWRLYNIDFDKSKCNTEMCSGCMMVHAILNTYLPNFMKGFLSLCVIIYNSLHMKSKNETSFLSFIAVSKIISRAIKMQMLYFSCAI